MSSRALATVILAAGKRTRMKSELPKVLHDVCGRPMLAFSLAAAESLEPQHLLVVVGRGADAVRSTFAERAQFVAQEEQRGTGHAVLQCREALEGFHGDVVVPHADTPLLRAEPLKAMIRHKADTDADLLLLSAPVEVPGIVIRDESGRVARIVEATDASPEQLEIEERNTGVYLLGADLLWKLLAQVDDDNAQGEIYLTDIVELAVRERARVEALCLDSDEEALGVNTRADLARATQLMRQRILNRLMEGGVTLVDPAHTYVDAGVSVGPDTLIEPGCVIQGDSQVGSGVHLKPNCMIESSVVGDDVEMGPCAHLRPGSVIGRGARIGNFVEVKNSVLGDGVKADHLSYIGDADVGESASFGCGSIVVNYDGVAKHRTTVGERAFIGCNANLVAPVIVEADAFVAAGTTVTTSVPGESLAVGRARQKNIEGWVTRRGRKRE
jgi:bifunctional UDP-N-acetylglucosamine pyrophosphorylase/glucosamine-1-phosphate N-acetyltransferase